MPRSVLALAVALLLTCSAAGAQDLRLDFLDGGLAIRQGGGWLELRIGAVVPADSTLKLAVNSVAEFSAGGGELRVILNKPGVYQVSSLLGASRKAATWGFGRLLGAKLRAFFSAPGTQSASSLGTRAKESKPEAQDWYDEEKEAADRGNALLEQDRYEEAAAQLEEALGLASEQNRADYLFLIGYAWSEAGRGAQALQALKQARPSRSAAYYAEYLLLEGRLLVEAQAWAEALALFDELLSASQTPPAPDAAQPAWFLSAFCSLQLDDPAQARAKLRKVLDLGPDTDFGNQAKEILKSL